MNNSKWKQRIPRRVVITGLGVLAPNGCGKDLFWQACLQGRSGIRAITRFDASLLSTRIAGEIPDFAPSAFGLTPVECDMLDRGTQFAVAAANMALQDAADTNGTALNEDERAATGVYIGTAMASVEEGERQWMLRKQAIARENDASDISMRRNDATKLLLSYTPSAAIAAHHQLHGPCMSIATGCSAGADAIGLAFWKIQEGHVERMLAGGSDSAICLLGLNVFCALKALSTRNDEPERASRPYDAQRDGFVLAEGAAVLLLEEREAALKRGVHIYAEIEAYTSNCSAFHMAALPEDGMPLQVLLQQILEKTHLSPEHIGYINSHGSSTQLNEFAETAAYKECFGSHAYHIPISATKSMIGHTQGAASAIELLVTALALDQQILPPTINLENPDPRCDLDYIPNIARPVDARHPLRFALAHSSGFGGINTALVLTRHEAKSETDRRSFPTITREQFSKNALFHVTHTPLISRRVVVTGLGMITPAGIGKLEFWDSIQAGRSCIRPLQASQEALQPSPLVGQINTFRVENYVDRKVAHHTDRMTHLIIASAQEALQDAGLKLEQEDRACIGAVIANTFGGIEYVTQQIEALYERGPRSMSAYTAIAWLHVANVGQLTIRHGLQGYSKTPVNDLCGGLDALGLAYEAIRRGAADILLAGGCEAPLRLCSLDMSGVDFLPGSGNIPHAYHAFDQRAAGPVIAEGAGVCILEEYEHARLRNAHIYGEIIGYTQTCSPSGPTISAPPGVDAYTRALRQVLTEANLAPQDIACMYLDGRALPAWDAVESAALREVFGSTFNDLPCTIPRTQFGHSFAAAGAIDTICALLAFEQHLIPPTLNCEEPDPRSCPPGLVRDQAMALNEHKPGAILCSRGLGGSHTALAIRKREGMQP